MDSSKKMNNVIGLSIFFVLFLVFQSVLYAGEKKTSEQENVKSLYIQFIYENTGKSVNVNGVDVQTSKLSKFALKDADTKQEISYDKLVVDGNEVVGSRVYSEPGMSGMDVVEFSLGDGKFINYSAPMKSSISKKYTLKDGTLTLID